MPVGRQHQIEPVELAVVSSRPNKITDKNIRGVSPLWRGLIFTQSKREIRAYIKDVPLGELVSEVICGVVGRALGLPVPRPFIVVNVKHEFDLPQSTFLFASEDLGHPSLRRLVEREGYGVFDMLASWSRLYEATVFDEWIANPDRNQGNLLVQGADDFVLIDHARAAGGSGRVPEHLISVTNTLANFIFQRIGHDGAAKLRQQAMKSAHSFVNVNYAQLANACASWPGAGSAEKNRVAQVLSFLERRATHVPNLISQLTGQRVLGV